MNNNLKKCYESIIKLLSDYDSSKKWDEFLNRANNDYETAIYFLHIRIENIISIGPEDYVGGIDALQFYFGVLDTLDDLIYKNNICP